MNRVRVRKIGISSHKMKNMMTENKNRELRSSNKSETKKKQFLISSNISRELKKIK